MLVDQTRGKQNRYKLVVAQEFQEVKEIFEKEEALADVLKQHANLTILTRISLEANCPPSGPKLVPMACSAHSSKKSGTSCSACNENQFVKL